LDIFLANKDQIMNNTLVDAATTAATAAAATTAKVTAPKVAVTAASGSTSVIPTSVLSLDFVKNMIPTSVQTWWASNTTVSQSVMHGLTTAKDSTVNVVSDAAAAVVPAVTKAMPYAAGAVVGGAAVGAYAYRKDIKDGASSLYAKLDGLIRGSKPAVAAGTVDASEDADADDEAENEVDVAPVAEEVTVKAAKPPVAATVAAAQPAAKSGGMLSFLYSRAATTPAQTSATSVAKPELKKADPAEAKKALEALAVAKETNAKDSKALVKEEAAGKATKKRQRIGA
jgi:hypothetical protein